MGIERSPLEMQLRKQMDALPSYFEKRNFLRNVHKDVMQLNDYLFSQMTKSISSQELLTGSKPEKVEPKPVKRYVPSEPNVLRDGFWGSKNEPQYPMVQKLVGKRAFKGKELFLKALGIAEGKAKQNRYKGWATCRLCEKPLRLGSTDYVIHSKKGLKVIWPDGYAHYIEVHNVRPTKEFAEFILGQTKFKTFDVATRKVTDGFVLPKQQIAELGPLSDAIKAFGKAKRGDEQPAKLKPSDAIRNFAKRKGK